MCQRKLKAFGYSKGRLDDEYQENKNLFVHTTNKTHNRLFCNIYFSPIKFNSLLVAVLVKIRALFFYIIKIFDFDVFLWVRVKISKS